MFDYSTTVIEAVIRDQRQRTDAIFATIPKGFYTPGGWEALKSKLFLKSLKIRLL